MKKIKFFNNIKLDFQLKQLENCRKKLLRKDINIIKNCVLMVQEIGIPEDVRKRAENMKVGLKERLKQNAIRIRAVYPKITI